MTRHVFRLAMALLYNHYYIKGDGITRDEKAKPGWLNTRKMVIHPPPLQFGGG